MKVTRNDEDGYTIAGLTHAQARGLDLLLSSNHSGNSHAGNNFRPHPVWMPDEQRRELDALLHVMLPVLGGLVDENTDERTP